MDTKTTREAGMVTVEFAITLPAIMLMLVVMLDVGRITLAKMQCIDAATAGARLAARGSSDREIQTRATLGAPSGSHMTIARGEDGTSGWVTVSVINTFRWQIPGLPPLELEGRSTAHSEGDGWETDLSEDRSLSNTPTNKTSKP